MWTFRRALRGRFVKWCAGGFLAVTAVANTAFVFTASDYKMSTPLSEDAVLRFGMLTDLHSVQKHDRPSFFPSLREKKDKGIATYALGKKKLRKAIHIFKNQARANFVIQLGDLTDMVEGGYRTHEVFGGGKLRTASKAQRIMRWDEKIAVYNVLGNHDLDSTSKKRMLDVFRNTDILASKEFGYYSFSRVPGLRCIVLDACFDSKLRNYDTNRFDWRDSWVPPFELRWLRKELDEAQARKEHVLVFVHQRLDKAPAHNEFQQNFLVKNGSAVRAELEKTDNVLAVFQGHDHAAQNTPQKINGIWYYSLRGMLEGVDVHKPNCAIVEVLPNCCIEIHPIGDAQAATLPRVTQLGWCGPDGVQEEGRPCWLCQPKEEDEAKSCETRSCCVTV